MRVQGMDSTGLAQGQFKGWCKYSKELSGCTKFPKLPENYRNYLHGKNVSLSRYS